MIVVDEKKLRDAIIVRLCAKYAIEKIDGAVTDANEWIDRLIASCAVDRPEIVCLCGSTRFMSTFNRLNSALSRQGKIVLSVELTRYDSASDPQKHDPEVKRRLDELHKRKIDLCDTVFVLDVGGYIGESTRSEIEYAEQHGKPIKYLSVEDGACFGVNACAKGGE